MDSSDHGQQVLRLLDDLALSLARKQKDKSISFPKLEGK